MRRVLLNFTSKQLKELDRLVKQKGYQSRSEAIRDALIILLKSEKVPELKKIFKTLRRIPSKIKKEGKIIQALTRHPTGLSLLDIAKITHLHRHTVRKYVRRLVSEGLVREKRTGPAKICLLTKRGSKL